MILFSIKTIPLLRPLGLSPQGGRYRGILLYTENRKKYPKRVIRIITFSDFLAHSTTPVFRKRWLTEGLDSFLQMLAWGEFQICLKYQAETKRFWTIGYKLFHEKFVRYMSGYTNAGQVQGSSTRGELLPSHLFHWCARCRLRTANGGCHIISK